MGFRAAMESAPEDRSGWETAATILGWVVVYFWAVWLFNAMLPPVPEQTPVEVLMQQRMNTRGDGSSAPAAREAAEQQAAGALCR